MNAKIIGTGSYLPPNIATNDFLATLVETNDEWVSSRTGIRARHLSNGETTTEMASIAAKNALENAGMDAADLDLIIVGTISADNLLPSTACGVQEALGAKKAVAFDINAACSGFLFALNTADAYLKSGMYKNALIIGVETLSKITDWTDRSTCILFGDGAGAAVVTATEKGGLLANVQGSDGTKGYTLSCKSRTNNNPYVKTDLEPGYIYMDGPEVFKFAVKKVPEAIVETLEKLSLTPADPDIYLLHQANFRIISSISKRLKIPMEKIPVNIERCGNTSAASVAILLDETNRAGKLKEGDLVVLAGFGAGLTWGTAVLEW